MLARVLLVLSFSLLGKWAYCFELSDNCKKAYTLTFEGKFDESREWLSKEQLSNPENWACIYFSGFNDFMESLFVESVENDERLVDSHKDRISRIRKSPEHAFKRFALAELHLHSGMTSLRLGNYISGLLDFRKSYLLLEKNINKYPDFHLSKKTYYVLQAILSNIPDTYKDLIQLLGYETDQYVALEELNRLQQTLAPDKDFNIFRKEVNIYRAILMHRLTERYEEAYQLIENNTIDYRSNPVSCFIRGKIALDSKKTGEAIRILKHFAGPSCPFPYINYDIGTAYLYSLNDSCTQYFAHFIKQNAGDGLKNDTYLKLAWWGYISGNEKMWKRWIGFIQDPSKSNREKDRVAVDEAKRLPTTNKHLLTARITFDGGYYEYAHKALTENQATITVEPSNQLRYHYQLARIYQDQRKFSAAIPEFEKTVQLPFIKKEYFVPVAYFNLGLIYENHLPNKEKAIQYYKLCLDYKQYPFASTYRYKSDLALKRLEGR